MTLYPDPTQRPINGGDGWMTFSDIPPAVTPPAPPDRRAALIALAAKAADLHGPVVLDRAAAITGRAAEAIVKPLDDLIMATRNLGDLGDGADPAQMLGDDYAGPNGADLAREAMLAAQRDALDRLLGGAS